MKVKSFAVFLLSAFSVSASIRIALFPLENTSGESLYDWIGYAAPDILFRNISVLPDIHVWDPVFLFQADSSAWRLNADSLVTIHANRWKWETAVGGTYTSTADSVWIRLRTVRVSGARITGKEWKAKGTHEEVRQLCSRLTFEILVSTGYEFSRQDSEILRTARERTTAAYATYARGSGYEMHGRYSDAVSAYSHAADLDRQAGYPLHRLALLYESADDKAGAREAYNKAVGLLPHDIFVIAHAARFYIHNESAQKSEAFISQYRRELESSAAGLTAIGMSFAASGEFSRATGVLTRAIAGGPSDLEPEYTLGRIYLTNGAYEQAADIFRRLIEYRPLYSRYYAILGAVYRKAGRLMESSRILELAVEYSPNDVANLINLSVTYYAIGWYGKAEQMLVRARQIDPSEGGIYLNLGVIYWQTGKSEQAREMFALASRHASSIQYTYNNEANILLAGGALKHAIKAYRRADKAGMKREAIVFNMGQAYLALGRSKEAAACFDEVLLMSPDRVDVLAQRADIAERLGDTESAEENYRRIVRLSPRDRTALTRLIQILVDHGRLEEAADFLKSALDEFPGDRTMRQLLPSIYARMEWHEVAIMEYENLLADKEFANDALCRKGMGKSMYALMQTKNQRNYDQTIAVLKTAGELDPADPEIDFLIGDIYLTFRNQPSLAVEYFNKAQNKTTDPVMRKQIRLKIAEAAQ
jgi:tetratricopeptide (TPR) repeat protein